LNVSSFELQNHGEEWKNGVGTHCTLVPYEYEGFQYIGMFVWLVAGAGWF
jgi:hypothetical protein